MKNIKNKFENVRKYLIEEEITYTEKFDGTNISKDKNGCIYTRRKKIEITCERVYWNKFEKCEKD